MAKIEGFDVGCKVAIVMIDGRIERVVETATIATRTAYKFTLETTTKRFRCKWQLSRSPLGTEVAIRDLQCISTKAPWYYAIPCV